MIDLSEQLSYNYVLLNHNMYVIFSDLLFEELQWLDSCLVNKKFFTVKSREIAWTTYHKTLLQGQSKLPRPLLATLSRSALQVLLDDNFRLPETTPPAEPEPVSDDDKDIVQYIAGFVVYRLRKVTKRLNNSDYRTHKLEMITAMIDSTGPCTSLLVKTKQRGGLLSVESELLPVFTKMEYIIRVHTCSTQVSMDTIVHLLCNDDKLTKLVVKFFNDRTPSLAQDMVDEMYLEVVQTYVTTRINGYCRQLMENLRKESKTNKAQKALRKSLKQSQGVAEADD